MKILLVTDLYPVSDVRSGNDQTQAVKELVLGAEKYGLEVVAIIRFQQFIKKAFRFRDFFLKKYGKNIFDVPILGFRTWFLRSYTRKLISEILAAKEYDLVVCHMSLSAYRYWRVRGEEPVPKVLVVHRGDFRTHYLADCYTYFDGIFARSDSISRQLKSRFSLSDVSVLNSGIPGIFFSSALNRTAELRRESRSGFNLVYAGELKKLKNIDSVIVAVKKLNDCGLNVRLNVFGVGSEESKLKKLANKLNLSSSVIFNGWVGRDELPEKFRRADIFVMPSSPETFGLVYLEAMASGCIILGHKGEGIDGIVTDEVDALMVDSPDAELIAKKIKWFASLTVIQRSKIRERVTAIAESYDMNSASRKYYESLLAVVRKNWEAKKDC